MYKDKPLIIAKRPFWRHPVFPWGWYSLLDILPKDDGEQYECEGHRKPGDGKGGAFFWDAKHTETPDSGQVFMVFDENQDLPPEFINDALKATEEIEAGETEPYIRRDK